jgi:hypothetical protein
MPENTWIRRSVRGSEGRAHYFHSATLKTTYYSPSIAVESRVALADKPPLSEAAQAALADRARALLEERSRRSGMQRGGGGTEAVNAADADGDVAAVEIIRLR